MTDSEVVATKTITPNESATMVDTLSMNMSDVEQMRKLRRRAKLEGILKAGCGYGKKRKNLLDAFWKIVWPGLEKLGWSKVEGAGHSEGAIYFYPPKESEPSGKRKYGPQQYEKILDVIEFVTTGETDDLQKIAKAYLSQREIDDPKPPERTRPSREAAPALDSAEQGQRVKRARSKASQNSATPLDLSWKDHGGTLYPKHPSRVGDEYQATEIPPAGTYVKGSWSELYEQVWDPSSPKKELIQTLVLRQVPTSKREQAVFALGHKAIHGDKDAGLDADSVIKDIKVADGSDWSQEDTKKFDREIFRVRKDMTLLAKAMGKDVKSCYTYYLANYKHSDRYRLLKSVCSYERARRAESNVHGVDACAICGDGGSLLICDGCEGEYHMGCLRPPLKSIPEGHWECDECVDKKLLKAYESIVKQSTMYVRNQTTEGSDTKTVEKADADTPLSKDENLQPSPAIVARLTTFAKRLNEALDTRA
eukprot:Nitzschia sp. Nitz4//scaffold56_size114212//43113//44916//NITZ4_003944-RA/size114212-snap-gene-0.170-mRNA-1//1//CDS//3329554688//80//frame0